MQFRVLLASRDPNLWDADDGKCSGRRQQLADIRDLFAARTAL